MYIAPVHADISLLARNEQQFDMDVAEVREIISAAHPSMVKGYHEIVVAILSTQDSAVNGLVVRQGKIVQHATTLLHSIQWLVVNQWTINANVPRDFNIPVKAEFVAVSLANGGVPGVVSVHVGARLV